MANSAADYNNRGHKHERAKSMLKALNQSSVTVARWSKQLLVEFTARIKRLQLTVCLSAGWLFPECIRYWVGWRWRPVSILVEPVAITCRCDVINKLHPLSTSWFFVANKVYW